MESTAQGGAEASVPGRRPDGGPEITAGRNPHRPASVGFLLSQLGFATAARFREALSPLGIDPGLFATLRALAANEGQSQQAICAALHMAPSRMVGMVDALEARGLVERRVNANDRRARAVHLTPQGREALGRAVATAMEYERWLSTPLEPEERERLLELLSRLAEHYGLFRDVHPELTGRPLGGWPVQSADTARRARDPRADRSRGESPPPGPDTTPPG